MNYSGGERLGIISQVSLPDKAFFVAECKLNRVLNGNNAFRCVIIKMTEHRCQSS